MAAIKLSEYRPYIDGRNPNPEIVITKADDNNDPSNWELIFEVAMPDAQTIDGRYQAVINWLWNLNAANRSAYFAIGVNGAPGAGANFMRVEPKDALNVSLEALSDYIDFDGSGDLTIGLYAVVTNAGGVHQITIPPNSVDISIRVVENA